MTKKIDKSFYDKKLGDALDSLHSEGRYRTFIEIERARGNFPNARWIAKDNTERSVTVWCGNDYLGMGESDVVLKAMQDALSSAGAGSGGTRNISATPVHHKKLEYELAYHLDKLRMFQMRYS